jgi:decaprenylphospho-beta-D-ribofuranose 2-oxidase
VNMQRLAGWGQVMWSHARLHEVDSVEEIRGVLSSCGSRGAIARGLGRSYGDAAQNSGGDVISLLAGFGDLTGIGTGIGEPISLDDVSGQVLVAGNVVLEDLLRVCVPRGWFVPVTPGTRFVTIGGAIAADIHGKNHHCDGSLGRHVLSMRVLLSSGDVVDLDPQSNSTWFWATIGGMGLTGIILHAVIQLIPISSHDIDVTTQQVSNIEELMNIMGDQTTDDSYRYSVAWVDVMAAGDQLGRGVLTRGNHSTGDSARDALMYEPKARLAVPKSVPNSIINSISVKLFNSLWFQKAPSTPQQSRESITSYFHPLDGVRNWNRVYGNRGFIQYQVVIPLTHRTVITEIVRRFQATGIPSFLAVLKRMGPSNEAPLSFPIEGWTFTVDVPANHDGLSSLLFSLDELVVSVGGRHYLAKDAHVSSSSFAREYPRLNEWREVAREMDPQGIWTSDLSRRLKIRK